MKKKLWVPRPYQVFAICWVLARKHSGLFLDPGLGKTSITLAVLKILKFSSKRKRATLIIAPKSVMWTTWPNELKKWRNFKSLTFCVLHGQMKDYLLWNADTDIYLMNPGGLPWLEKQLLEGVRKGRKVPFDILWVDESTKFKNPTAPTLFKILENMLVLFKRRHIMTGTPAAKAYEDLWAQAFIMDRGAALEDNYYRFRQMYFVNLAATMANAERKRLPSDAWQRRKWIQRKGSDLKAVLSSKIAHLVLNMSERDYLKLPPLVFNPIYVELPPSARKHYNEIERDAITYIQEHKVEAASAIAKMIPCWQVANGCVYESVPPDLTDEQVKAFKKTRKVLKSHTHKVDALVNLVEELNGKPLFIVYWFKHDLQAIQKALKGVQVINSKTKQAETVRIERDWNAGKITLLAGQVERIAHGLNMQDGTGRDMAFFSLFWSPEGRRQAIKRIHRSGVDSTCTIHDIIAKDTIDEVMYQRWFSRHKAETKLRDLLTKYRRDKELSSNKG